MIKRLFKYAFSFRSLSGSILYQLNVFVDNIQRERQSVHWVLLLQGIDPVLVLLSLFKLPADGWHPVAAQVEPAVKLIAQFQAAFLTDFLQ